MREHMMRSNGEIVDVEFHPSGAGCRVAFSGMIDNTTRIARMMCDHWSSWAIMYGGYFQDRHRDRVIEPGTTQLFEEVYMFNAQLVPLNSDANSVFAAQRRLAQMLQRNQKVISSRWVSDYVIVTSAPDVDGDDVSHSVLVAAEWAHDALGLYAGAPGKAVSILEKGRRQNKLALWPE
jgi:hypothetical protein